MKKKGFTLIELLAVIIILAVIALIAAPVVLNIIEQVKIKSAESSAKGYAKAVEYEILNDTMFKGINLDGEYNVVDNTLEVVYQGTGPTEGYFILENNTVKYGEFCINGYGIKYENSIGKYAPNEVTCEGKEIVFVEPEGIDSNQLCLGNINYDNETNFKIRKVEDLVCISKLSSEGKTFKDKNIMLVSNVDINDDKSYNDINDTTYGDINGNGVIEGIKVELTTEQGFLPIGSSTTPFSGTFEGYAFTLSNIYINRSSMDNVGLFGYVSGGLIRGFNIKDVNITGNENVGGVVGELQNGIINEITLNGNVSGSNSIGGVVGHSYDGSNKISSVLVSNINVNTSSNQSGGIIGYAGNYPTITGIAETGNAGQHKIGYNKGTSYASTSVISTNNSTTSINGLKYTYYEEEKLNGYDNVLDTWIGGDNDSSGYYFDYDDNGELVIRSVEQYPITFTLKGSGTESDPYIINNYQQWKEATTKVKQDVYFKLNNDIDFSNKHYYAMGSSSNYLVATIDGNNKTISNITMNGTQNSGLIGYSNTGTIKKLNIDTATIQGYDNIGIIGYNNGGKAEALNVNKITVTGNDNVGGIVGYNISSGIVLAINVKDVNITGNENVGGVVGELQNGIINEITLNGNVSGSNSIGGVVGHSYDGSNKISSVLVSNINVNTSSNQSGGIIGYAGNYPTITGIVETGNAGQHKIGYNKGTSYASTSVISTNNSTTSINGTSYSVDDTQNLAYYSTLSYDNNPIIESKYIGDVNTTGYYFDYGNDGYIIVVPVGTQSGGNAGTIGSVEIDSNYTMTQIVGTTDTEAPTCELYYVRAVSNGIQASFSCTDNSGVPILRSLFDSTTSKSAATFDNIGTLKNGSVSGNTKTVVSTWNIYNTVSQPTKGTCYYFRYGAQDAEGNFSTYVTNVCYTGFSE